MIFSFLMFIICSTAFLFFVNKITEFKHPFFICTVYSVSFIVFCFIDFTVNTNFGGTVCAIISGAMTLVFADLIIHDSKKEKMIK